MSPKEIQFCHDTCRAASAMGMGIREYTTADYTYFEWRLPDLRTLKAKACANRQPALLRACRTLSLHLAGL